MQDSFFEMAFCHTVQPTVVVEVEDDEMFQVCAVNPAYTETVGPSENELIGEPLDVLASRTNVSVDTLKAAYSRCRERSRTVQYEVCTGQPAGASAQWQVALTPVVRTCDDGSTYVSHIIERRTDLAAVGQTKAEAGKANRPKSVSKPQRQNDDRIKNEFLAGISHGLRTSLTGVLGFVDMLLESDLDAEQSYFADTIHRSARRLLTLVDNILRLRGVCDGELAMQQIAFRPVDLLKQLVDALTLRASMKGIELSHAVAAGVPDIVVGDQKWLFQLIHPLLAKAVEHTKTDSVTLAVHHAEEGLRFAIQTGPGRSENWHEILLHPSQRNGAGVPPCDDRLGLTITARLAHLMDSNIRFDTQTGETTTVFVTVPLKTVHEPETPVLAPAGPAPSANEGGDSAG